MGQTAQHCERHCIAYYISPHGFGHGARAAAVMERIHTMGASIRFEVFTSMPHWFFQDSLSAPFAYHALLTDIGLVQRTPLQEDPDETIRQLDDFLPFKPSQINNLAQQLKQLKCELVLCDIAPLGIAVAHAAGLPSVLIENFTWDWIYDGYRKAYPQMDKHVDYLRCLFESAHYRIQTEPVCLPQQSHLTTGPVSRTARIQPDEVRQQLGIPADKGMVLITMGGIPDQYDFLKGLTDYSDIFFVIPGGSQARRLTENLVLLPHHSNFHHPDLVNASDAVIGKLGYSTLAEVYHAGVPFGYVSRPSFRESQRLADYVEKNMAGMAIEASTFHHGTWIDLVPELLNLKRIKRTDPNGSETIAGFITSLLGPCVFQT